MRWNPRRRQVTSVVYVQSGKKEAEKPKSPWNSLEVWKLCVGALTPLFIAIIGVSATVTLHRQDVERAQREDLRVKKAAADPLIEDLQNTVSQVSTALMSAEMAVEKPDAEARDKALSKLNAAITETRQKLHDDNSKLRYIINEPAVINDLASSELAESIEVSLAMTCVIDHGMPNKPQCTVDKHVKQLTNCNYAKVLALRMFELIPIRLDGIDTRGCYLNSMVLPTDLVALKKAYADAAAMTASVAASAASH